jgi:hypothetical protein
MRDLAELNINFGGKPVERPAPTPELISAFEREFRLSLPEDHVTLLMYANGGHPELNMIDLLGGSTLAGEGVTRFYYLDGDQEGFEGLWKQVRVWRPVLGDKALPIAGDAFGNVYYLDMSSTPARVLFCDHEQNFATLEVAPSFGDFIDSLRLDPDTI